MEFLTVAETAARWGVSERQVQRLIAAGKVSGAKKLGWSWVIPADSEKPSAGRGAQAVAEPGSAEDVFYADVLTHCLESTQPLLPARSGFATLTSGQQGSLNQALAYLRGDFASVRKYYLVAASDDAATLAASGLAIAAAISLGDYAWFLRISADLKRIGNQYPDPRVEKLVALCRASATASAYAFRMVPDWIKDGQLSGVPAFAVPDGLSKRALWLHSQGRHTELLMLAQTALTIYERPADAVTDAHNLTFQGIYFRLFEIMALVALKRAEDAHRKLNIALELCVPHGFLTPFVEKLTYFGGLLEMSLKQYYPEYYDKLLSQWECSIHNWIEFHNQFTQKNITQILSLRQYQIAILAAQGLTNLEISERIHLAPGTVQNQLDEVCRTLLISGRNRRSELSKYVLFAEPKPTTTLAE